jgi:hypothetical protein
MWMRDFGGPHIFLGNHVYARGQGPWTIRVTRLIACVPTAEFGPPPSYCTELTALLPQDVLSGQEEFFERIAGVFKQLNLILDNEDDNVLFWCRSGLRHSAVVFAMWILWQSPHLYPEDVMRSITSLRPAVQCFLEARASACGLAWLSVPKVDVQCG